MIEPFIQDIVELIYGMSASSIYLVFFLVAYGENIVPPIPGDILVAFGGYLAAEAVVGAIPLLLLTTVASVLGFLSVYWIGSHWGHQLKEGQELSWVIRFIPVKYLEKVRAWMGRWGVLVILANRFLAGTRSVIALAAGLSHTRISHTILYSFFSSILWNGILLAFGWFVHRNWQLIGDYLSIYGQTIFGLIFLGILIRLGISYYRKKTAS